MDGHAQKARVEQRREARLSREYDEAIYVINAYQKKSKKSSQEPQENINTTKIRLKWAEAEHAAYLKARAEGDKARKAQQPKRKGGK